MALLALNAFPGTGGVMQVELSFAGYNPADPAAPAPYFDVADIKARIVTPATGSSPETSVDIGITKINTMTFKTNVVVPIGKNLYIYRATNIVNPIVDFISLQVVSERDLDNAVRQVLFSAQEANDQGILAAQTATSAQAIAVTANTTANAANTTANTALTTANSTTSIANAAINTANAASTKADNAVTAANVAGTKADNAAAQAASVVGIANTANANAAAASIKADNAAATAAGIDDKATLALSTANSASTKADTAVSTANGVDAKATSALDTAAQAQNTAASANTNANTALAKANSVDSKADNAVATANAANTAAANATNAVANLTTSGVPEGTRLYFTAARAIASAITGLSPVNAVLAATDTLVQAVSKLQGQITATLSAITAAVQGATGNRGGVGRNILHNTGFLVAQRTARNGSGLANAQYVLDRWQNVGAGGAFTTARYPDGTNPKGGRYQMTITAGNQQQVVEDINLETGTYTVSWDGTARLSVIGASTNTVFASSVTSPATFTFFPVNHGHMILRWGTGTLDSPQLERGSIATPYEGRDYALDLLACQRYYWRAMPAGFNCAAVANAFFSFRTSFPVRMRIAPASIGSSVVGYTPSNLISLAFDAPTTDHFRTIAQMQVAGGAAADFSTANWLEASAEL